MIVDAAVHPLMPDAEYAARLPSPWRDAMGLLPQPFGKLYEAPFPDADETDLAARVLTEADVAVLAPPTRGLLPNPRHLDAVARATNDWQADTWLTDPRWRGSVRVAVTDPPAAVAEIERHAGDGRFVQVAVPLRVHDHYGDERYFPIWAAAARHGFPVYVLDDLASASEPVRSPVGQPATWAENDALRALLSLVHLSSLVVAGVFGRLPDLRFVFGDGGAGLAAPLLWRLDKDWRSGRVEAPWLEEPPSATAARHAVFVTAPEDVTDAIVPTVWGSRLPFWDRVPRAGRPGTVGHLPRLS